MNISTYTGYYQTLGQVCEFFINFLTQTILKEVLGHQAGYTFYYLHIILVVNYVYKITSQPIFASEMARKQFNLLHSVHLKLIFSAPLI